MLHVETKCSIKEFILENSLIFKTGRGFYEFTKPEIISHKKEVLNCLGPTAMPCTVLFIFSTLPAGCPFGQGDR